MPRNWMWNIPLAIRLIAAKPWLVQEFVRHEPWKVLVAAIFLNVTNGNQSIPIFWNILQQYPTPQDMANADLDSVIRQIEHLGLGNKRARALIRLSQMYVSDPPRADRFYPSRAPKALAYPPTPVSHYPWMGVYALDSYRIFCAGEWESVLPQDKELRKYIIWKYATAPIPLIWHPEENTFSYATEEELHEYCDRETSDSRHLLEDGWHLHREDLGWWTGNDPYRLPSLEPDTSFIIPQRQRSSLYFE